MGSATTQARAQCIAVLDTLDPQADFIAAQELFEAERVLLSSPSLIAAIADTSTALEDRTRLLKRLFGSVSAPAFSLLTAVASERWSAHHDIVPMVEELAIRTLAAFVPQKDLVSELFAFERAVSSDAELELVLRGKLVDSQAKTGLITKLLGGKASPETIMIVTSVVLAPRGRSIRVAIHDAARIVAAARGRTVATVISAEPLQPAQASKVREELSAQYGDIALNRVVNPDVMGGLRIEVGHTVLDGSVISKLTELRLQLVG